MELYASRKTRYADNIGIKIFKYSHFSYVFVHTNYTSNMAARYGNDVNSPYCADTPTDHMTIHTTLRVSIVFA